MSEKDLGHENSRPGFKYHTSKWDCNIIDLYALLWDDLKGKDVSILEFGVYFGESLRYWKEFFGPESKIIGADHCPVSKRSSTAEENTKDFVIEICEQYDTGKMQKMAAKHGPFDLVVDDAQHHAVETENTFRVFWGAVNPGGWYVIEDCASVGMPELVHKLMSEITTEGEGKGVYFESFHGFNHPGGSSPAAFFKKSGNFTGLIR